MDQHFSSFDSTEAGSWGRATTGRSLVSEKEKTLAIFTALPYELVMVVATYLESIDSFSSRRVCPTIRLSSSSWLTSMIDFVFAGINGLEYATHFIGALPARHYYIRRDTGLIGQTRHRYCPADVMKSAAFTTHNGLSCPVQFPYAKLKDVAQDSYPYKAKALNSGSNQRSIQLDRANMKCLIKIGDMSTPGYTATAIIS